LVKSCLVRKGDYGLARNAQGLTTPDERVFSNNGKFAVMKRQMVLPAPPKLKALMEEAPIAINRIFVPIDFSPLSKKALLYAARLAKQFGAEVLLFHALEPETPPAFDGYMITPPVLSDSTASTCARRLRAEASSLQKAGLSRVAITVRPGLAGHEIVEAAKDLDADLIVIATHGYTGWKHFAIGSTAERVVRAASCPVLVVREKEHDFV
jgi:nucleotide-binding universal stress UspA family protein